MSDNLDFLDGDAPVEPAVASQPVVDAPQEPQDGQPRGPDGKFAPKAEAAPSEPLTPAAPAPEPAPTPAPAQAAAEPVSPQGPPPGYVPVAALQELRKEIQALRQAPQQSAAPPPDLYEDPDGHVQYVRQQAFQEFYGERLNYSREIATLKHSPEVVEQAHEWGVSRCDNDPIFNQQVASARNPYEFVVNAWKQDRAISALTNLQPGQLDALLASLATGQAQAPIPAAAPAAVPQTPTPPQSLATAPAAGGNKPGQMPVHEGAAFDAIFTR